jgi:hypothetical protein
MADCFVPDGGPRFPEVFAIRFPAGFLALIKDAADAEGISPRDFVRRAVAERISRSGPDTAGPDPAHVPRAARPDAASPSTPHAAAEAVTVPVPASPAPPPAQAAAQPAQPPRRRASWTRP